MVCKVDGCKKLSKQGSSYCSMHTARLYRTGRFDKITPIERLLNRIEKTASGCWNYTQYLNRFGYGRLRANGTKVLAHRLSYQHFKGEIPSGMMVCHTCDNPACVNPDHLFLGTAEDNARDMGNKQHQWLTRAKAQGLTFKLSKGVKPNGYKRIK